MYSVAKITTLRCVWRSRVLVEIVVFIHLKVDCSEILCVGFSNPKNSILSGVWYMIWIKSYLHVNVNVEISCLNLNNLRIISCIKILAAKSNFTSLKSLWTKCQLPPHKDERKHSFSVTSPIVEKWLSLVANFFLNSDSNSHQTLIFE